MENNNLTIKTFDNPYPIWIIDNFFQKDVINKIKKEWLPSNSKKWHHGHETVNGKKNILEDRMCGISKSELMPNYIAEVFEYLHSDGFTKKLGEYIKVDNLIGDKSMRWSGMRTMLSNSFQLIHSDARRHPINGLRKELSCLIYINEDYNKDRDEGCLEIWNDDMSERIHEIEPINNRLAIFLNSDTSLHGVPLVNSERKSMTFSVLKNGESTNRTKALFVKREIDPQEVELIGKERAKMSDKNIENEK